jgi:hypothetical protein
MLQEVVANFKIFAGFLEDFKNGEFFIEYVCPKHFWQNDANSPPKKTLSTSL